jgi:hypothetical protein
MLENDVKTSKPMNDTISRHDYGPAIQGALAWLGNRYLLAEPLNRRSEKHELAASEPQRTPSRAPGIGVMA